MKTVIKQDKIGMHCILAAVYFAVMPISIVPLFQGFSILKLIAIPMGMLLFISMFIGDVKLKFNSVHLALSLYAVYTFVSILQLRDENAVDNIRGFIETYIIGMLITIRTYNEREQRVILNSWVAVGIFSIILGLFGSYEISGERTTVQLFGGEEDPNQFCGYFVLPMLIYMERFIEKDKFRPFYIALFLISVYVILRTGSRGGFIGVAIAIVLYMFMSVKGAGNRFKLFIAVGILSVLSYIVLFPLLPESVQQRFSVQSVIDDKGSGRFELWETVIKAIFESDYTILFGRGIGSTGSVLNSAGFFNNVAHNHWLQVWCDQGITGVLLFAFIMASGILHTIRKKPIVAVAVLGMIALSMSLTLYASYKAYWNVIMMAAINYEVLKNES